MIEAQPSQNYQKQMKQRSHDWVGGTMNRGLSSIHQVVVGCSPKGHTCTHLRNPKNHFTDHWERLGDCSERIVVKEKELFCYYRRLNLF